MKQIIKIFFIFFIFFVYDYLPSSENASEFIRYVNNEKIIEKIIKNN